MTELSEDVHIESFVVGPNGLEVSYVERRNVHPDGTDVTTCLINDPAVVQPELDEALDAIRALIDRWLLHRRNPPASARGRG